MDETTSKQLKDEVFAKQFALSFAQYVLIGAGSAMILHASMLTVILIFKKYEDSSLGEYIDPPN